MDVKVDLLYLFLNPRDRKSETVTIVQIEQWLGFHVPNVYSFQYVNI